jgi:PilZ domain-containing protein
MEADSGLGRTADRRLKFLPRFSDQSIWQHLAEKGMDPNIICEQPGFSGGGPPRPGEDGASYLRRLKGQSDDDSQTPSANAGCASPPTPAGAVFVKERRRSPRFQCSGSVELQPHDGSAHMWGALRDISLHGCYVEMPTTFPTETQVSLTVEVVGIRFSTQAKVRVSYPSLGMGMCFTEIKPEQQTQLQQLLRAVAGQRATLKATLGCLPEIVSPADPKVFVEKLAEYFKKNSFLSRDEFYAIAKRVCRP